MEQSTRLTKIYADSLYSIIKDDENLCRDVMEQYKWFTEFIDGDASLKAFLESDRINRKIKQKVLEQTLRGRCHDMLVNFLQVLVSRGRFGILESVYLLIHQMIEGMKLQVEVTTAVPLAQEALDGLVAKIEEKIQGKIKVETKVDPQILGGIVVTIGDKLLDGSLRCQLDQMKKRIIERSTSYGV